jgi:hypothetical protein
MKKSIQIILLIAMLSISILAIGCQNQDNQDVAKRKMAPSSTNDINATTEEKTPGGDKF